MNEDEMAEACSTHTDSKKKLKVKVGKPEEKIPLGSCAGRCQGNNK
jgi:hypothetical protein